MKILLIDIETSEHIVRTFQLHNVNIRHDQILVPSQIMCFAAQWYGEEDIEFWDFRDRDGMLLRLWQLLDEADAVCHWYGERFDVPRIKGELWQADFLPYSPIKQIDLWKTAKTFGLASSSLAYVSNLIGREPKAPSPGSKIWLQCWLGDENAWKQMRYYCAQDVKALGPAYESFLPWMTNHPSYGAFTGENVCPNCGCSDLTKQGFRVTKTGRYQRYQCDWCGAWSSDTHRTAKTEIVSVAS